MKSDTIAAIEACVIKLKLPYTKQNISEFLLEAAAEDWDTQTLIAELLTREAETRKRNDISKRLKRARFPYVMDFDNFVDSHLTPEIKREVKILKTLSFIEEKSNVVLIGNPGVGKTALSIALGTLACNQELNVAFINIPNLVIEMKEAMSLNELTSYKRKFERYDLVILDDLGYCSFNKECGEVLFNLLSNRNEKGSMIITTSLVLDRWIEVFDDPVLTGAIVDRLAHKAHVIDMTGNSYRVIETKEWIEQENKQ